MSNNIYNFHYIQYLKNSIEEALSIDKNFKILRYSKFKWLKNRIDDIFENEYSYQEKIWRIMNLDFENKICHCGNKSRFCNIKDGYSSGCCISHAKNSQITLEKRVQTNMLKYGCANISNNQEIKDKKRNTNIKKYGVSCNLHSEQGIQSKIQTWMQNFGGTNPMHNIETFDKVNKNRYKNFTLPSGSIIKYQGYEDIAIKELLKTLNENDICFERKNIPRIKYNGNKLYYPDLYIPHLNKIIEVKSKWTYYSGIETNILKRQACLDNGYLFEFWICSDKTILEIIS